jgi:hypothetical protein
MSNSGGLVTEQIAGQSSELALLLLSFCRVKKLAGYLLPFAAPQKGSAPQLSYPSCTLKSRVTAESGGDSTGPMDHSSRSPRIINRFKSIASAFLTSFLVVSFRPAACVAEFETAIKFITLITKKAERPIHDGTLSYCKYH